jgi:hypothetical protein
MNFLHERDFGDIVLSLSAVKAAGGGNYYIQNNPKAIKIVGPLIEFQSYIKKVGKVGKESIDKSFVDFRKQGLDWGVRLASLHAKWIEQDVDFSEPWLTACEDSQYNGKIIVNKTERYANPLFPWVQLVKLLGSKMLFVGHDHEYELFCRRFGKVERLIIRDYLHLATAINSSDCFIGNQSSANCVAEGLKHKSIQEVCLWQPDCIYKRDNATFCYDGTIDTEIAGVKVKIDRPKPQINKQESPAGGWKLTINGKLFSSYALDIVVNHAKDNGVSGSKKDIEDKIIDETITSNQPASIPDRFAHDVKRVKELLEIYE